MVADLGIDQIKIYKFDDEHGGLTLVDALRCELESAPRHFFFSKDGRFIYLMYELKNVIDVFTYETGERSPKIEKIQTVSTTGEECLTQLTSRLRHEDVAGREVPVLQQRGGQHPEHVRAGIRIPGLLTQRSVCRSAATIRRTLRFSRDQKHVASINHESGSISFFKIDYEQGLLIMSSRSIRVNEPNCCAIVEI